MQFFQNPNINFVGPRKLFFYVSALYLIIGIVLTIVLKPELGIDFEGGTEIAVEFEKSNVATQQIRQAIQQTGLSGSEIKSFGEENQYLIRVKETEEANVVVKTALEKSFPNNPITILKVDKIGPKIGSELRTQAGLAVLLAVFAILIYIAFRFQFVFGLGAIVALIHDVLFTFSTVVIVHHFTPLNLELNQALLAAMLTVVGYSINDTVIIFDRIRENREKTRGLSFVKMINQSINETLSRTVNTVLTTMLVLLTLVFFGGPVLQSFSFTMLVGIITGTFSSIYIASSFVIWYNEKIGKVEVDEPEKQNKGKLKTAKS